MSTLGWVAVGVVAWCIVAIIGGLLVGRSIRVSRAPDPDENNPP